MEGVVFLLTLVVYGVAAFLWWQEETPHYLFALVGGHFAAFLSPLWIYLYDFAYTPDLRVLRTLFGQPFYQGVFFGSSWFYTLPALLVLFLFQQRWWFPGYISTWITYIVFLIYHMLIQSIGTSIGVWKYMWSAQSLGISPTLIAAIMAALVSLGLCYTYVITNRYSWQSMLAIFLVLPLFLSVLVHGLLGASLWVPIIFEAPVWAYTIGMYATLLLLLWAVHILAASMARVDLRR
jgi:hypothetical protein